VKIGTLYHYGSNVEQTFSTINM